MVILFGIDVIPLGGVSAILVVMQGFVVGSWCTLCLVSAAVSLLLVYFAYGRSHSRLGKGDYDRHTPVASGPAASDT